MTIASHIHNTKHKETYKRVHFIPFRLREVQEQAKLMCGDSSQNRGALEEGCLVEGVKRGPSEC